MRHTALDWLIAGLLLGIAATIAVNLWALATLPTTLLHSLLH